MTEPAEPTWMTFDEVSAFMALPEEDVARLLLAGLLRFEVVKRSPSPSLVVRMDVRIAADDVRALQKYRWASSRAAKADDLVNRAALKHGVHPTRKTPGVRGRARLAKTREPR